jgi:hypothetical protein
MGHTDDDRVAGLAADLSGALDRVGDALVRFDADELVETEPVIADLAARLGELTTLTSEQRARLTPALAKARESLARCERLGASLNALAEETLQLASPAYTRTGRKPGGRVSGRVGVKV